MKTIFLAATLLISQMSFAAINGSAFTARHQDVIQKAIASACGLQGAATLVSTSEKTVQIDQGIIDVHYSTELNVQDTTDTYNAFDFKVVVESVLSDMYDHPAHNWGAYSVTSVTCVQK